MAGPLVGDRVKEQTTTSGTGTVTLAGAQLGFRAFSSVLNDGDTCFYCIQNPLSGEWEVGVGTYTASGTTLARNKVYASSNANALVNFASGTKDVFITFCAEQAQVQHGVANGRLTLTSATPVTAADVTAATTFYYTPYNGNRIGLWDGNAWQIVTLSEQSLTNGSTASSTNYDVWAFINGSAVNIELTAWSSATLRNTGSSLQPVLTDGVYTKSADKTRRFIGTIRADGSNKFNDAAISTTTNRGVWNMHNRVMRHMTRNDPASSWTYTTLTWRQANANASNTLFFVRGLDEDAITCCVTGIGSNASSVDGNVGVGVDSTTVNSAQICGTALYGAGTQNIGHYVGYPGIGSHQLNWLELSRATGTSTWIGTDGALPGRTAGIIAWMPM
jgi:hypothetical protein